MISGCDPESFLEDTSIEPLSNGDSPEQCRWALYNSMSAQKEGECGGRALCCFLIWSIPLLSSNIAAYASETFELELGLKTIGLSGFSCLWTLAGLPWFSGPQIGIRIPTPAFSGPPVHRWQMMEFLSFHNCLSQSVIVSHICTHILLICFSGGPWLIQCTSKMNVELRELISTNLHQRKWQTKFYKH